MQYPNPKIKFYKIRTFNEKFNATFDFLRETWKPLLKFSLYLILPVCLIQAFAMNACIRFMFSLTGTRLYGASASLLFSLLLNYGVITLCIMIGSCILSALVYSLMQEYDRRENRLADITLADLKNPLLRNMGKIVKATFFFLGALMAYMLILSLLTMISPWTMALTVPLLLIGCIAVFIPISLFIPLYIFEDQPFSIALKRAFSYGFSEWGEIFVVLLVFGLLGSIINTITMMPWHILVMIKNIFTLAGYEFVVYLFGIAQAYGSYLSTIITSVGLAFQYFHTREKKEGVSVNESIANFNQL